MGVEERAEDDDDYKVTWGPGIHSHEFGWCGEKCIVF